MSAPAAAPPIAAPATPAALPALADGTPVKLTLKTNLNSSDAKEKKSVSFVVADDVLDVNGKVIIPAGTPATGRVLMPSIRAGTNVVQGLVNGGRTKQKSPAIMSLYPMARMFLYGHRKRRT